MPTPYVRQSAGAGAGDAVLPRPRPVGASFAVMLGDDIVDADEPCIGQMIRLFEERGNPVIALQEVPKAETRQYGIVAGKRASERIVEISDMVEKPPPDKAPSNLAIIGRYLLPPEIFDILEETRSDVGGEIQLTQRPEDAAWPPSGRTGYLFEGRRYDAGDKLGFLKATVEFALQREDLGGHSFKEYLKGSNSNFRAPRPRPCSAEHSRPGDPRTQEVPCEHPAGFRWHFSL